MLDLDFPPKIVGCPELKIFPCISLMLAKHWWSGQPNLIYCNQFSADTGLLQQRFVPDTTHQLRNHYDNATTNCKILLCIMTLYAVVTEGDQYFPDSPFINDEAFANVIKGSSLVECNDDNKNNYNTNDSPTTEDSYKSTIDGKSYTTDGSSYMDFNHFDTTTYTQQDTQSIKSNEIDGSLNESKHEPRKGIIDILYTNENYTNAAKYVNEEMDRELLESNHRLDNIFAGKIIGYTRDWCLVIENKILK